MEKTLGMIGKFAPMVSIKYKNSTYLPAEGLFGLLVLTKHRPQKINLNYYTGTKGKIPVYSRHDPNSANRLLLKVKIIKNGVEFTVATTHFTWSPRGTVTSLQRLYLKKMLKGLESIGQFVLVGDFNAPRGKEIYDKLAKLYTDNIPLEETTTLDPDLHRVKNLQFVVDGMFSTPQFKVSNVRVVGGISDHKAIIGIVTQA